MTEAASTLREGRDMRAAGHARLGMSVFLGTWVMLFASLFLAYAVVRGQAAEWPPPSLPRLPRAWPGLATLILLVSSAVLRGGVARARRHAGIARRVLLQALTVAALLGIAFVVLQAGVWRMVLAAGLTPATGTYASVFFALTIFHALHVICGLAILTVVAVRTGLDRARDAGNGVWLAAIFWDFVTVVWVVIYAVVFWL